MLILRGPCSKSKVILDLLQQKHDNTSVVIWYDATILGQSQLFIRIVPILVV